MRDARGGSGSAAAAGCKAMGRGLKIPGAWRGTMVSMETLDRFLATLVDLAWGPFLLILLFGGGFVLTLYSRFLPFRGGGHGVAILLGRYDRADDPGQISHFKALSTALSSTIGMGNIGGVAIAITQGGPGAVFWMWLAAVVGMATKFFTCTLAVLYRGRDSQGVLQGGPMYTIHEGLGRKWRWLAIFFAICGLVGCLGMFQTNQLSGILASSFEISPWLSGGVAVGIVAVVIVGGIQRIATVAAALVPAMCVLYLLMALVVLALHASELPGLLWRIFHDAFTGTAAVGGTQGIAFATVVRTGIKRAAFSNEAGIGTAPMAHGAAKTTEPVREGLVAMVGPFIDTIVVCTITALVVLVSGLWQGGDLAGSSLTASAVEASLGPLGRYALVLVVILFAMTTMFGYAYYGRKCFAYLFGAQHAWVYNLIYLAALFAGAVWSADMVLNLLDTAFALMALPNMLATLLLAPRVMAATRDYFTRFGLRGAG